jgi:hypothetical protein
MELTKKHFAAMVFVAVVLVVVLVSLFPLKEPEPSFEYFEDKENFYEEIPDYVPDYNLPPLNSEKEIPLNVSIEVSDCLGEIKNNDFVPDERNPSEEELDKPVYSIKKNSLKLEYYSKKYCRGSDINVTALLNTEKEIFVFETEELNSNEFIYGPTTVPPEERWICLCNYKVVVDITGIKPGKYPLIVENKDGKIMLVKTVEVP